MEELGKLNEQLSSPDFMFRLTPQERNQYKGLQQKQEQGRLSAAEWELYKRLGNKATGSE